MVVMFGVLLLLGQQIYQQVPPIPEAVKSVSGETLYTRADIETGQNVWQSIGGIQQGSIWGHTSYIAPDWSSDWLGGLTGPVHFYAVIKRRSSRFSCTLGHRDLDPTRNAVAALSPRVQRSWTADGSSSNPKWEVLLS